MIINWDSKLLCMHLGKDSLNDMATLFNSNHNQEKACHLMTATWRLRPATWRLWLGRNQPLDDCNCPPLDDYDQEETHHLMIIPRKKPATWWPQPTYYWAESETGGGLKERASTLNKWLREQVEPVRHPERTSRGQKGMTLTRLPSAKYLTN